MTDDAAALFQPVSHGTLHLPNRIAMAPLTRNRATHGTDAPNDLNATYYRQRAGAGLIISEATQISRQGQGYAYTPGIYTGDQVEGWTKVTKAVHDAGGRIFLQLWHVGRVSHTSLQADGAAPVAPSAIRANTRTYTGKGFEPTSQPRALEPEEIALIVRDYLNAAENAKRAGFDGVEVHGANGYLLDQFMRDGSNHRTDYFGGALDNRLRLTVEVVEAMLRVFDPSRVGVRISPVSPANDMADSDPAATFGRLVELMNALHVGMLHVVEGATGGARDVGAFDFGALRRSFKGLYMANNGYTRELAEAAVSSGAADLVAFGRPYIANPDLVERLRRDAPLNALDQETLYGGDAHGYTDYPALGEKVGA